MSYTQKSTFAPSQNPYAVDPESWDRQTGHIDAIWAGRKNGVTTITAGTLKIWAPRTDINALALPEALAQADTRYGGDWELKWDGEELLVNPVVVVKPQEYLQWSYDLDSFLERFPAIPDGYSGWWYRS